MTTNRRDVIKGTLALAGRSVLFSGSIGVAASLTSCGGGGGGGGGSNAPQVGAPSALAIAGLSSSSPMALTPLTISTTGLDVAQPFTVNLVSSSGSTAPMVVIRTQSDGSVIVAVPLVVDATTGQTTTLSASVQITQGNLNSAPATLSIVDLPPLSTFGTQPGQISQAFNTYTSLSMAQNINFHQAVGMLPNGNGVPGAFLTQLQSQFLATVNARNIIDNVVANPSFSLTFGNASDGSPVNFDASSASVLDRMLAQYLAVITNQSITSVGSSLIKKSRARASSRVLAPQLKVQVDDIRSGDSLTAPKRSGAPKAEAKGVFFNSLTGVGAVAGIVSTYQTLTSNNTSTTDKVLSVLSTTATVIAAGATITAAIAATPEIAAAAVVYGTYATLAATAIGGAMVANDVFNGATSYYAYLHDAPGSAVAAADLAAAESAGASLISDGVGTFLNANGIGALDGTFTSQTTQQAFLMQAALPASSEVAGGLAGLLTGTANMAAQSQFDTAIDDAKSNMGQGPLATPPTGDFTIVDGMVTIANSNGPTLSPLPGVEVNTSTTSALTTLGDSSGNYSLIVPQGNANLPYSSMPVSAYDPITGTILDTVNVDLSTATPDQVVNGPALTGTCTDTDATDPDGDDPDCD